MMKMREFTVQTCITSAGLYLQGPCFQQRVKLKISLLFLTGVNLVNYHVPVLVIWSLLL